jgi:glucose-6-phosphate dehydrogenase assembly protein OpcA
VGRGVDVASIERELAALWQPTGDAAEQQQPATRACMSNLLIYCETGAAANEVAGEIDPIVQQHPSRVLILVSEDSGGGREVDAFVSATCYAGEGGRRVCAESVTIYAGAAPERRLPATARPLVIGDLPTALWWTSAQPAVLAGDLFRELASMSQQLILDSGRGPTRSSGLPRWRVVVEPAGESELSDLAWTRTHPWRSALGQSLAPQSVPGALGSIRRVDIEYGSSGTSGALLVAGWIASRLGWEQLSARAERGRIEARYRGRGGEVSVAAKEIAAPTGLQSVTLAWDESDEPRTLALRRMQDDRLGVIRGAGAPHHVRPLGERGRAWLVARELADLGRDRVFHEALQASRRLVDGS